ncbi:hypothetical protein BN59_00758 [Legionella massiliensis]|uniref:Uncharacterized protein n=2 Tax=Legionella massiliensis TaxID=1034943 RepID=A0A078KXK5_9GAMM|nr:hypothetical protein BN59_00758 [Legionella massiliensis]CEE12227.1 hypothetical protein BN1094_00758 [Legionella massiliensis]
MLYDTINLRALVNLTLNFGGVIKKTSSNRCRIEIQNIYAFICVPEEALARACNTATVVMHGGGHRSTRSQNNDRENAPDYLIEQFKDAFTRAGFTQVNLGLNGPATLKLGSQMR